MNLIVAIDNQNGIGKNNKLLAHIPTDLEYFKKKTLNKVVIMGRKTLESLPGGRPLKNRTNIILTNNMNYKVTDAIVVHSMYELFEQLKNYDTDDIFIIGGAAIYKQFAPLCTFAYVTHMLHDFDADTFAPSFDKWERIANFPIEEDNGYNFYWATYRNTEQI